MKRIAILSHLKKVEMKLKKVEAGNDNIKWF